MAVTANQLRRFDIFRDLDDRDLQILTSVLKPERILPAGTVVCSEGEAARCCYFVLRGSIDVSRQLRNGTARHIGTIRANQFFGEMALADSAPRSANCAVKEEAELLRLDRSDFEAMSKAGSPFALRFQALLAGNLAAQLRNAHRRLGMTIAAAGGASTRAAEAREFFLTLEAFDPRFKR
jgi:CRP-like cAMP-binding protein